MRRHQSHGARTCVLLVLVASLTLSQGATSATPSSPSPSPSPASSATQSRTTPTTSSPSPSPSPSPTTSSPRASPSPSPTTRSPAAGSTAPASSARSTNPPPAAARPSQPAAASTEAAAPRTTPTVPANAARTPTISAGIRANPTAPTVAPTTPTPSPPPPAVVRSPPPPAPRATPSSSSPPPASSPPPTPPAPPGETAVQALLQVAGPNVSPFTPTKQAILIYALASVMTSVPQRSIGIILVVAASSANRRRLLSLDLELLSPSAPATHPLEQWRAFRRVLHQIDNVADAITAADPQATLNNVVDVTVQFNASSETATSAVIQELYTITDATTGSLQAALQAQGESSWGVTLLSTDSARPSGRLKAPQQCRQSWAGLCLDGSGLSSAGVKGIVAAGVIVVVGVLTGLCVWFDVRRRSGREGNLEFAPDSPWHATPMARYLGHLTGGRIGTPRKPRTPKVPGQPGQPGQVQMSAHAGDHDREVETPHGNDTPDSEATTVSPQARDH